MEETSNILGIATLDETSFYKEANTLRNGTVRYSNADRELRNIRASA